MNLLLAILTGYILGSLSPSYLLGRLLRKIDIRQFGDRNAGTVNTYRVLGLWPAILTAIIDLGKGLFALYLALHLFGLPYPIAFLAPVAAIIGHVAPFYMGFRGGQGAATAVGLLLYGLGEKILAGEMPPLYLGFLALVVLTFAYIARQGEIVGMVVLPLLGLYLFVLARHDAWLYFLEFIIAYIFAVNLFNFYRLRAVTIRPRMRRGIHWMRFLLRPLALIFPLLYGWVSPTISLVLLSAVLLLFLMLDIARLGHSKINLFIRRKFPRLYKAKEAGRISSITMFLLSMFLVLAVFPFAIALTAILFLIFGDMFAKFFGLQYGRSIVFDKTLEGSLAFLMACLITASVLVLYFPLPIGTLLAGALAGTIAEILPTGIDDNLTVTIISAAAMYISLIF